MKLTALDIRKQEFSRTLRGYDPDEVDSFIEVISDQWKEMVDELKRDNDRISELELKLEHYHKVEEALEEALQTARTSARQTIVQADIKAKKILEAAEEDAEKITRDARDHRRDIKREAAKFSVRRKEIVAKLRAFLLSEMEMLAHYDDDDPTGFLKLLGDAAGQAGGQPQLTAGSPVSEALEDEQDEKPAHRPAAASDTAQNQQQESDNYDEYEEEFPAEYLEDYPEETHARAEAEDDTAAYAETPDHSGPERSRPEPEPAPEPAARHTHPQEPEAERRPHADTESRAPQHGHDDQPSSANDSDSNDEFQSEYTRMATIDEIYGQFDPNGTAEETGAETESRSDAGFQEDDDYSEYGDGSYEDFVDEGYVDQVNGTGDGSREYPNQSRPAQDRPPADSPAASGRRAPGMNRPDAHQELSESASEDIEKIRRILEDLDN